MRKAGLDLAVGSFFYSSFKKRNNLEQAARCLVDHHIHIATEKGTKKEMAKYLFTSESVTEGHPDKICDQISDAVLDAILEKDPDGRVACETAVTTGMVLVMGEISTKCYVDIPKIAREVIRDIGYDRAKFGFDCDTCGIITSIDEQSGDIALGVDRALEAKEAGITEEDNGAGDQGMMFGFACDDTPELMPMPISLAHKLAKRLAQVRKDGTLPYLRPDGKTQVTIEYEDDRPVAVETIVVSNQHSPDVPMEQLRADIKREVIDAIVPKELMRPETKIFINPTGRFVIGGPQGDSGLTGRKIIVDTYGGMSGRDMDALAVGLDENTEFAQLDARIRQVKLLGDLLDDYGVPYQRPAGGHAIFIDAKKILPNLPKEEFIAQTLGIELYLEAGIRGVEIGSILADRDPETHENRYPKLELLRLAIPRRVYTDNHIRVIAAACRNIYERRESITSGYKITFETPILRHFTVELEPVKK